MTSHAVPKSEAFPLNLYGGAVARLFMAACSVAAASLVLVPTATFADRMVRQVQIEARFVTVDRKFTKELGVDLAKGLGELALGASKLSFPDATNLGLGASPSSSVINQMLFPDDEPGPIKLNGILTQQQVDAVMAAIAKDKHAKTIEAPVVHTQNNEAVHIDIPSSIGFEGVYLNIVPEITPDGLIRMAINPETEAAETSKPPLIGDIPVLGALFRDKKTDTRRSLAIFVTPTLIDALSPSSGGYESGDPVKTEIVGTGETIGHVADLKIQNLTDRSLNLLIPALILESKSGTNQATACPHEQNVALDPHQTKMVPMNGVCINRDKPPVGKGVTSELVLNTVDLNVAKHPDCHIPAKQASDLLRICSSIYDAVETLQKDGALKDFPYKDKQEQENILVQWSTWMNPQISEVTGSPPATKEDITKVVYEQAEKKAPVSAASKKKLDEGINTIFEKIELTTEKAKELNAAASSAEEAEKISISTSLEETSS